MTFRAAMTSRSKSGSKMGDLNRSELESIISEAVAAAILPLTTQIQNLCGEVEKLKSELKVKDEAINSLQVAVKFKCDELEQYGRRNNIRIFGVPENKNEDTDKLVIDVAKRINVDLKLSSIDRSHRVGITRGTTPRPILVKFTSYATRKQIFQSKKLLKNSRMTIREDLTRERLSLLKKAIESYTERNVWSSDGVIKIKVGTAVQPLRVRNEEELASMLERHPPSA